MSSFLINLTSGVVFHVAPAYLTYAAAIAPTPTLTRKWLMFWIVHTLLTFAELLCDIVLAQQLLYSAAKLVLFVWLVFFDGASVLYSTWVRGALQAHSGQIDQGLEHVQTATASGAMQLLSAGLQRLNPQHLLTAGLWASAAAASQAPLAPSLVQPALSAALAAASAAAGGAAATAAATTTAAAAAADLPLEQPIPAAVLASAANVTSRRPARSAAES